MDAVVRSDQKMAVLSQQDQMEFITQSEAQAGLHLLFDLLSPLATCKCNFRISVGFHLELQSLCNWLTATGAATGLVLARMSQNCD